MSADDDEMKLIENAVKGLPCNALDDLITQQVCVRCIFRLFNIHEGLYAMVSEKTLSSFLVEKRTLLEESSVCPLCLGVLQFSFVHHHTHILIQKDHSYDFAMLLSQIVKETCHHQFPSFTLQLSLPTLITENEQLILSYMKNKYLWFSPQQISVKDAFKLSITHPLETFLGVQSRASDFRICLTYHLIANKSEVSSVNSLLKKVGQPCQMTLICSRAPIFIGGRYLKLSRNVSQTRWIIDDERKGEASVEELIGDNILPVCKGDSFKFHAAGREDIDVRMLGSGRPFLIEIQNARHIPSEVSIKEMETKINSLESNLVRVKHLKALGSQGWSLMREGEAEKQKQYAALVWISRPIKDDDLQALTSLKDLKVLQRTPVRVLHRRSPLDREKIIHWMKVEEIAGSSQYFLLHLCTQAGTYIKEFVHGDLGRTHPSIGSILGCRAEILQLDVTDVKMEIPDE